MNLQVIGQLSKKLIGRLIHVDSISGEDTDSLLAIREKMEGPTIAAVKTMVHQRLF